MTDLEGSQRRIDVLATQILQLRTEMRGGFSAIREEFRREMRDGFAAIREEFGRDMSVLGSQMRLLHEDVIGRLKLMHETGAEQRASRRSKKVRRQE